MSIIRVRNRGFTVVELIVVVVVIAVLAAVSTLAYNGMQRRASESSLQSDVTQAQKLLEIDKARNRTYPEDIATVGGNSGLPASGGKTAWQYTTDGSSYCLTGTREVKGVSAFHITSANNNGIQNGPCDGHSVADINTPVNGGGSSVLAGSIRGYIDGTGTAAQFTNPFGLAVDKSGVIYVADGSSSYRIRKVTPSGVVTTLAGSGTSGHADGTGTAAQFGHPSGLVVDGSGNVYVADSIGNRIRKVTPSGTVTTLAGNGASGSADGTGTAAQFNNPSDITIDSLGYLYVADINNNRIRKITPSGVVTTLAGGTQGYADGTGTSARLFLPRSITVDGSRNVYVLEESRIRKITPSGVVTTLAGSSDGYADGTGTAAKFSRNYGGIAATGSGTIYVADGYNNRIRKVTSSGVVTTLVGTSAGFNNPSGIAITSSGTIYIGDNYKVSKIE